MKWSIYAVLAASVSFAVTHAATTAQCATIEENTDYPGYDIKSTSQTSAEKCCADCANTTGCKLYVWNSDTKTCFLKSQPSGKSYYPGARAAQLVLTPGTCSTIQKDIDLPGNDIGDPIELATVDLCCTYCSNTKGCVAYAWSPADNSGNPATCYLKSKKGTPTYLAGSQAAYLVTSTTKAPTTAPTTAAPTIKPPTTAAPTTKAPTTAAPTTTAATTAAPTTTAATTAAPTTTSATTAAPTTTAATTAAPTTTAATTAAPTTTAATTAAPTTTAATTAAPTTTAATTAAPTTTAATTAAPTTTAATTPAPTTTAATTAAPTTTAATTAAPTTTAATTAAPTTTAATTAAPTTTAATTAAPTTTAATTPAPTTTAATTAAPTTTAATTAAPTTTAATTAAPTTTAATTAAPTTTAATTAAPTTTAATTAAPTTTAATTAAPTTAAPTTAAPATCNPVQQDTDYPGNDLVILQKDTVADCCTACSSTAGCVVFVWVMRDVGTCILKNAIGQASTFKGAVASFPASTTPTVAPTPAPTGQCAAVQPDTDYPGNDLVILQKDTVADCCAACSTTSGCKVFVWVMRDVGTCILKSAIGQASTFTGAVASYPIVPTPAPTPSVCSAVESDVDYAGNDIMSVDRANYQDCCSACKSISGCSLYVWSSGTCYLKSSKGEKSSAPGAKAAVLPVLVGTTPLSNVKSEVFGTFPLPSIAFNYIAGGQWINQDTLTVVNQQVEAFIIKNKEANFSHDAAQTPMFTLEADLGLNAYINVTSRGECATLTAAFGSNFFTYLPNLLYCFVHLNTDDTSLQMLTATGQAIVFPQNLDDVYKSSTQSNVATNDACVAACKTQGSCAGVVYSSSAKASSTTKSLSMPNTPSVPVVLSGAFGSDVTGGLLAAGSSLDCYKLCIPSQNNCFASVFDSTAKTCAFYQAAFDVSSTLGWIIPKTLPTSMTTVNQVDFYVTAHQDDHELFMSAPIYNSLKNPTTKAVFVYTSGGDAGQTDGWWQAREFGTLGATKAWVNMFGAYSPVLKNDTVVLNSHHINKITIGNAVHYFLRLSETNLGSVIIDNTKKAPMDQPKETYANAAAVKATLKAIILAEASKVAKVTASYSEYLTDPDDDHYLHVATGQLTAELLSSDSLFKSCVSQTPYFGYQHWFDDVNMKDPEITAQRTAWLNLGLGLLSKYPRNVWSDHSMVLGRSYTGTPIVKTGACNF
ncbi:hypothetical protein LEN26_007430 [Aphanomyces euteiches]|nr:hypothetical protein LEN26_007430 [Aphanomyces euteiches]